MKKIHRHMLTLILSVVFFALAPLIVLYAMGYRLSTSQVVDPIPVGVLLIETEPTRSTITINDDKKYISPEAIPNLPPGDVNVKISKAGYTPWEKNISISSARVTDLRSVWLLPDDQQTAALFDGAKSFSLSPSRRLVAIYANDQNLHIIDEEGININSPIRLNEQPTGLLWSPDNRTLVITYPKLQPEVININTSTRQSLSSKYLGIIKEIVWDPRIPSRLLALNQAGTVHAISLDNDASETIATDAITISTSSRHIYVAHKNQTLSKHNLQGKLIETLKLPEKNISKLFITPGSRLAILMENNEVFIMDDEALLSIANNITSLGWSPNGELLYLQQGESTLYIYNPDSERPSWLPQKELHLITRLSQTIKHPQWFAGSRHLIYQIADQIILSEIDTRNRAISSTINSTNLANSEVTVGEAGESLFFLSQPPGQPIQLTRQELVVQ